MPLRPLRLVDLFAGCGGLTTGFLATERYESVGAVELDGFAAATYALNHGKDHLHHGDIAQWVKGDLPEADVVVGGPPCQGFSNLGHRYNRDPRNALWRRYVDVLERISPQVFLLENVDRFLTSGQLQGLRRETYRNGRLRDYAIRAAIVVATDHGAYQRRRRAIVIGTHRDLPAIPIPEPDPSYPKHKWRTVRDAIGDLPAHIDPNHWHPPDTTIDILGTPIPGGFTSTDLHVTRFYQARSLERFAHIPVGGNRLNLPEHLKARCWVGNDTGSLDVMGRLHWDRPSVTIRTEFHKPEKGRFLHPEEHRTISHHEAARLQGFPDDYKWAGPKDKIAEQIGNAVPVQLASALAHHIHGCLDSARRPERPALPSYRDHP